MRNELIRRLRAFDKNNRSDTELLRILDEKTEKLNEAEKLDFLCFAERNDLNPLYEELWACSIGGGLKPYISINGWCNILQKHIDNKKIKGVEWEYSEIKDFNFEGCCFKSYEWIECILIFNDERSFRFRSTIYDNFVISNQVWRKYAGRMLQNKALSGALRMFVSKEKIYDDDEIQKIRIAQDEMNKMQKSGNAIRSLKDSGVAGRMFISNNVLFISPSTMENSMLLKSLGFSFNRDNKLWEVGVDLENDIDTVLVLNKINYESKLNDAQQRFYKILGDTQKLDENAKKLLVQYGFQEIPSKGMIAKA